MAELLTFEQCMEIASSARSKKRHLVLGNGFSVDLFPDIFNYKTLSENIDSENIKELFTAIDTPDFEFVMRRLLEASQIVGIYDGTEDIKSRMIADIEELKQTLVSVIAKSHPQLPNSISDEQYETCREFLFHFDEGKAYTFNYDLLLYWVYMHFIDDDDKKLNCNDGFGYDQSTPIDEQDGTLYWEVGREHQQKLYYIHGAMHIFSDGADVEKLSYKKIGVPLADQVKEAVKEDKFPVFISEGSRDHKEARIKKNGYLSRGMSSLHSITGNLFFFGHSLRSEDDHVLDLINDNKSLKKIFISIFGEIDDDGNQPIIKKVEGWRDKYEEWDREYYFYSSNSANVWRKS